MKLMKINHIVLSLVLLGFIGSYRTVAGQAATGPTTQLAAQSFTDLKVNGTEVWKILAGVGGAVGGIIVILLILVICAFVRRGSKIGPPSLESGPAGHYILDPQRFPSVETQTDYHPGFSNKIAPKMDRATMTKRSLWSGIPQAVDGAEPTEDGVLPEGAIVETRVIETRVVDEGLVQRREAGF